MADWKSLERVIEGEVLLAGSPIYEAAHPSFNARFHDVRPLAIVSCETADDVSASISFARRNGLEVAARSGGHSFAGHSTCRGIVINVRPMRSVSVSTGVATVGAGTRLGEIYDALEREGLTIPGGTCPSVGVTGLSLGGGLGILGRAFGVTSDHLIGAEIVIADGAVAECDAQQRDDLFWALRGGGAGNFGVVTRLMFRTIPAPNVTNFRLTWPFASAATVIEAWQEWAPSGPDELAASLKVTVAGDEQPPSVDVYGALQGHGPDAAQLLDDLVARARSDPTSSMEESMTFTETRRFWATLGETADRDPEDAIGQAPEPMLFFAKSEFFRRSLPREAITGLLDTFTADRRPARSGELDFMPWGGAYNRVRSDATAFVHRDERFLLKHQVLVPPDASTDEKDAAQRQVSRLWESVHPWASGRSFQNFADPDLENWADAYYGSNLERLVEIKARYDPDDVFRFDQSLPLG